MGLDDTDNETSRGTGLQARHLGEAIQENSLAKLLAVTRHQLLVDPRIDYTSRNSSACLVLDASENDIGDLLEFSRSELSARCAPDSNAGLAIAEASVVDRAVQELGQKAKHRVLSAEDAQAITQTKGISLEVVLGSGIGVIGALAALGLHKSGDDGRFIWLPELRDLDGSYTVGELSRLLGVEITTASGMKLPLGADIDSVDWMRPILQEGRAILLAEKEIVDGEIRWHLTDKPTVKALSD